MSEFAYPLGGEQNYTAAQAGAFCGTRTSGVWSGDDNLKVTITGARQLTLSKGIAWFTTDDYWGKVYVNTDAINFTLPVADAALDCVCRIVIRWDKTANKASAMLLQGNFASSPTAPERKTSDELYDLVLCDYLVKHGDAEATAAQMTDQRLNENLCGLMRDGVTRIPTETLSAQAAALIEQLETAIAQAFDGVLPDNSLTTAKYIDGSVTGQKIADSTIPGTKMMGKTLVGDHLADKTITNVQIADGTITYAQIGDGAVIPAKTTMCSNCAGAHNSIFRGWHLGSSVTAEQWEAISNGGFDGLYIGDYWTINGITWRIAAFDYYLGTGTPECTAHHAVIVPDTCLYTAKMNAATTTTGGYAGSQMRVTNLAQAKTTIGAAFGENHILSHRQYLCNAVTNGKPSGGSWYDSTIELMTERNVYGSTIFGVGNDGSSSPALHTLDRSQFPLFAHDPSMMSNRQTFWLRDIVSGALFARTDGSGNASADVADGSFGVRPAFAIKA